MLAAGDGFLEEILSLFILVVEDVGVFIEPIRDQTIPEELQVSGLVLLNLVGTDIWEVADYGIELWNGFFHLLRMLKVHLGRRKAEFVAWIDPQEVLAEYPREVAMLSDSLAKKVDSG